MLLKQWSMAKAKRLQFKLITPYFSYCLIFEAQMALYAQTIK